MSKVIEITEKGEKRIIGIGAGIEICPPNEYEKTVTIIDWIGNQTIYPDETYEELKAMLGIVNN